MQAIILAAGMGKRLGKFTEDDTKCMLKVNGKSLIERTLDILDEFNIHKLILVIGYKGDHVKSLLGKKYKNIEITYIENNIYYKTNNIYSLYLAKDYLISEDTILLESDLIFDKSIINKLLENKDNNLAVVAKYQSWMDGTVVTLNEDNSIKSFVPKKNFDYNDIENYHKTVNIYKFSKEFSKRSYVPFLEAYSSALGNNEYYEQVLRVITLLENQDLKAMPLNTEKWYEIDDIQDLHNAETIFADDDKLLETIQLRYGGYWRFPYIKDFCYLVNPYFPNQKMKNEMSCYFNDLLSQYPSGLNTQNILAAKMFNIDSKHIIVGNGAAELINSISRELVNKIGVVFPTFNEYPERFKYERVKQFITKNKNYSYSVEDLIEFSKDVDNILLINPDNPSGHFIPKNDIIRLIGELNKNNKRIVLDESFVDFTTEGEKNSLIDEEILMKYKNLVIVKSISKSYGVPGLRLGVMATSDTDFLSRVREHISIWNINSFAEFFLQIIGKYQPQYTIAIEKIAKERDDFFNKLNNIKFLRVIPSQSNYFLCEVIDKFTSKEITYKLLKEHNVFIKDLSTKIGFEGKNYIRIAVRDEKDNSLLYKILNEL